MLDELIHNLLKEIELSTEPSKIDSSTYQVELTPSLSISIKKMDPGYYFQTAIGEIPDYEAEVLFISLMDANLFGQGTGGGVLGISSEEKLFVFSKKILQDINYQEFKEKIEEFVNYVEFWRLEIANHGGEKNPSENTVGRRFRSEYEIRDFVVIFTWVILSLKI